MASVGFGTRIAYGGGAIGEITTNSVFNTFTFFYYTQILGLPGTLAGLAVTIALVFDAVSDPLVGSISDRWHSRFGRRHPFMFFAAIPLGVFLYLVFSPPAALAGYSLFLWFTLCTIILRFLLTLYVVPHLALGAELTSDYHERSKIMSYNALMGIIGGMSMVFIGYTWFFNTTTKYANGLTNPDAYSPFALLCAVVVIAAVFGCAWFTRRHIPSLSRPPQDQAPFGLKVVVTEIALAFKNSNYRFLLLGLLFLSVMMGTQETLALHIYTYFWEFSSEQIRFLPIGSILGLVAAFALTTELHRRFDKRGTIIVAASLLSIATTTPILLRMFGILPENGSSILLPVVILGAVFATLGGGVTNISVSSALADIADEHELNHGRRQEGVFYSARTFFGKCTSALGHLVAGIAIDVIKFPVGAEPAAVAAEKVFQLGLVYGPLASVPAIISVFLYARYRLNKKRHDEILTSLRNARLKLNTAVDS